MAQTQLDPKTWLDEHGDALYRYALMRLRDAELAEDMVQETLLAALGGRERFAGRSAVRTWLIGILKRKIVDHYRRSWREIPATDLAADADEDDSTGAVFDRGGHWKRDRGPAPWLDPRQALSEKEFFAVFQRCLESLPGRLADAFVLRELEKLDGKQVCQVLGITPTNLWAMLHRSRFRLRQCLEKNWLGRGREEKTP